MKKNSEPQFTVLSAPEEIDQGNVARRRLLLLGANDASYSVGALGTTHHIAQLAREMSLRGYEVHIALGWNAKNANAGCFAADPPPKFSSSPNTYVAKYDLCQHNPTRIGQASKALQRYMSSYGQFDVIHAIGFWGGRVGLQAKKGTQAQLLFSPLELDPLAYRGNPLARMSYKYKLRQICAGADMVQCASQHHMVILQDCKVDTDKLRLVPNGLAPPRPIDTFTARNKLQLKESEIWFGYCGRLDEHSGVRQLLTAFAELVHQYDKIGLLIVGSGPAEEALRAQATQLELGDRIRWQPSKLSETAIAAIDVYVQPGGTEAFPYNVMRATSRGLPVITVDRGGAAELIERSAAICVPPGDATQLVQAIALLAAPNGERQSRVPNALAVAKKFSLERSIRAFEGAYTELISA